MIEFGKVNIGDKFYDPIDDSKIMEKTRKGEAKEVLITGYLGELVEYPEDVLVELIDFVIIR